MFSCAAIASSKGPEPIAIFEVPVTVLAIPVVPITVFTYPALRFLREAKPIAVFNPP